MESESEGDFRASVARGGSPAPNPRWSGKRETAGGVTSRIRNGKRGESTRMTEWFEIAYVGAGGPGALEEKFLTVRNSEGITTSGIFGSKKNLSLIEAVDILAFLVLSLQVLFKGTREGEFKRAMEGEEINKQHV